MKASYRLGWILIGCSLLLVSCTVCIAQKPTESQQPTTTFIVNVTRVLVPVVVRDKQGRAVPDLRQEDFQVFNNGKPQAISRFTVEKREPLAGAVKYSNESAGTPITAAAAKPASVTPVRFIVFLFDDLHLSAEDLAHAKKASTKMLAGALRE
jgi:VWFA-related protein